MASRARVAPLLTVDVGNTNTVLALWSGARLGPQWRLETRPERPADELAVLIAGLLRGAGHARSRRPALASIVASVVPAAEPALTAALEDVLGAAPRQVRATDDLGLEVRVPNAGAVGVDRLVNCVAARARFDGGLLVADLGTATTVDVVSPDGAFLGGAIAAGPRTALDALARNAARLPRVQLERPARAVGRDTLEAMQSGSFFGYAGLVDGLVAAMTAEVDFPVRVVATGGLAPLFAPVLASHPVHVPALTLEGLRLLARRGPRA